MHGDDIEIETVKVGEGDSKKEIENSDLELHGIIAKNAAGKIVKTVEGHSYGKEKVEEVIAELKAAKKKS